MSPEGKPLRVSVVIATRNRSRVLGALLEALDRQTMARGEFEIIVVDDASSDASTDVVKRHRSRTGGALQVLRQAESHGPAAARNAGIRAAAAPIVAFTDDDCFPDPNWLDAAVGCFTGEIGIVQGATRARPGAAGYGVQFSRTMEASEEDGHYPTCNIFYRSDALAKVGGFDESFRYPCGEDTDLAWRVKAEGYDSRFCAEAVVLHEVRPPSFRLFLKERRRFADQVLLVRRHPHLRRFYYRRFFYSRSHVHAIVSLALIAAAFAGFWPGLVLLPVVCFDRFRHTQLAGGFEQRILTAAELLVGDFWELAVFTYCSLRYRTILL